MPLISCPNCQSKLRFPDDAPRRRVKCPSCSHFFLAGPGGEKNGSREKPREQELEMPDNLELRDEPTAQPQIVGKQPPPPAKAPEPDDDFEIVDDDDDEPAPPKKPAKASAPAKKIPPPAKPAPRPEDAFNFDQDNDPPRPKKGDDRPRSRTRDDDDDDRPRSKSRGRDDQDDRPRSRRRDQDDDEDDRPRSRRRDDDDFDDEPPRKRKKKRRSTAGDGFSFCDSIGMDYVTQSNIGVLIGIALSIGAGASELPVLYAPAALFWIWGCAAYAKNKGYSEWLGLLGLLSLLGLIVLVCLPNQNKRT